MTSSVLTRFVAGAAALMMMSACSATTEAADTTPVAEATREAVAAVEPTVASAPTLAPEATAAPAATPTATAVAEPTASAIPEPTATVEPTPEPTVAPPRAAVASTDHSGLAGTRGLTLQWISWEPEDWGAIEFLPLVDGSYAVSGRQEALNGDFVSVDGTLVRTGDRELLFSGEVVVQLEFSNNGEPCVRSGDIMFLATGERRFWRMQDLLNCDGIITDYVDIYFG